MFRGFSANVTAIITRVVTMINDKRQKLKILVVYHYIAKYRGPIFDALAMHDENIEFQFSSDILANNDIELISNTFYENNNFHRLENKWVFKGLWQRGLMKLIAVEQYDVVIFLADPGFFTTWLASIYLKFKPAKVIFWTHGFIRGNSLKDKLKLFFYRLADGIFLYGDRAKLKLSSAGVPFNKLYPIYNSLDYLEQSKIRDSITSSEIKLKKRDVFSEPDTFQIVFVGRLTPQKKLGKILELVHQLKKEGLLVNLLIIGDGIELPLLLDQTSYLGISSQVVFYGKTYNEKELAVLLMGSDLCVSPGEIGLTAMHVMAYGVPVITHSNEFTQMPEFEAVINGITGALFMDGDYEEMYRLVKTMINEPIKNISQNCIDVIEEKYNPVSQKKLIIEAIDALYNT